MMPFDDELEVWFDRVIRERKAKYGGDSDDDDEQPLMMQNEYARAG